MTDFDATYFVKRLLRVNNPNYDSMTYALPQDEIIDCLVTCTDLVRSQPVLVEVEAPMNIGGDIHGQYKDLLKIFERCGAPSKKNPYLFLGDYVDRGKQQLETICLLMGYKLMYPHSFYILRGNHECPSINLTYGFYDECKRRYSVQVYNLFQEFFSFLPLAALVGDRLFCMHGGLSPTLKSWDQLSDQRMTRPIREPQDYTLASDLLWADPAKEVAGYARSSRGVSFCFGEDVVHKFCDEMDIDLIVRAHQVVQDGYEFFADRKLVTVFSAPRYCGEEDNLGAVLHVNQNLNCSFTTIAAGSHKFRRPVRRAKTPIRI